MRSGKVSKTGKSLALIYFTQHRLVPCMKLSLLAKFNSEDNYLVGESNKKISGNFLRWAMIWNVFVSLPNRFVTLHEYCLVSCRTRVLTTSVLLTLKCLVSILSVMLIRELSDICLLPLNQVTSIGKFPTAMHVIVTSSDTLAGVFAGAVTMLAGTAGQDKHNKLKKVRNASK